ncbi:MAG: hypothetical protein WCS86_03140 [Candidatus Paceibacterota bacterium]
MSKRNVILLIIILGIIIIGAFGFLYLYQPASKTTGTTSVVNFIANFLPFGKSSSSTPTDTTSPTDVSGYVPSEETTLPNVRLKKVSTFPVAGFGVFMKERFKDVAEVTPPVTTETKIPTTKPVAPPTEFYPALRYVNRIDGNIFQTFADKIDERKFSSTIIPKVYEAYFGNKGESVVMRYLKEDNKTIETFSGTLQKEYLGADLAGTGEITGSFLPENISDISVSPDTSKVFYLFNIIDNVVGITFTLQSSTKIQVFDSPFTEWLSYWPNNRMITVTTKPSANVPGYMYTINPEKKDFNKVLGAINGLTTLTSPDGKTILYGDNNLSLSVLNIETGVTSLLGLKTLPEKCVWTTTSDTAYCAVPKYSDQIGYPDSWYRGEVSFSDEIWKIDIKNGNTIKIVNPIEEIGGEEVDAIKLAVDENQNYLFFVNKKDSYLWELRLK